MRNLFILLIVLSLAMTASIDVYAAADRSIDKKILRLEKQLETTRGEKRVDILNTLARLYNDRLPQKSRDFSRKALELAQKSGYLAGEAEAYFNCSRLPGTPLKERFQQAGKALSFFKKNRRRRDVAKTLIQTGHLYRKNYQYQKALDTYGQALNMALESGWKQEEVHTLSGMGNAGTFLDNYEQSLEYYLKALKISEELGDKKLIAEVSYGIGLFYFKLRQIERAQVYLDRALGGYLDIGHKIGEIATYQVLGALYRNTNRLTPALEQVNKMLDASEAAGYSQGEINALMAIGDIHRLRGDFKKALGYFEKSLDRSEKDGNKRIICNALVSIGDTYRGQHDYRKALPYFQRALRLMSDSGNRYGLINFIFACGICCFELKQYVKAEAYAKQGLPIAEELNATNYMVRYYELLYKLYSGLGDYKAALDYHLKLYATEKDILTKTNSRRISQLQTQYDTLKKEKETEVLKRENKIQKLSLSKTRLTRNTFIAGFLLLAVILTLLFKKYLHLFTFWKKQKYMGQFRLVEQVGSGAMGTVFRAHNLVEKSSVAAVKVLRQELFSDENSKERFKREAAIIDKLGHPNVIKIFEIGVSSERIFIAMEFLKGRTLEDKIVRDGPLPPAQCLHIMKQVTAAVTYIHGRGIIHRDLKPGNIMLVNRGGDPDFVKLLDFGLARAEFQTRLTQSGNFVGTIEYMAPEQFLEGDVSVGNDIFAMGVVFYRMLGNLKPFTGESIVEVMSQLVSHDPPPLSKLRPQLPPELAEMVMNMIHKKPARRPTAASVQTVLDGIREIS